MKANRLANPVVTMVLAAIFGSAWVGTTYAQPAPDTPTEKPTPKAPTAPIGTPPATQPQTPPLAPGELRPARPDVYYLRDKDGRLVPVPDFSYEDFKRLYDLDRQLTESTAPPAYVLQHLGITGKVVDQRAALHCELKILVKSESWVRFPLRFSGAALVGQPTYEGSGNFLVEASRDGDGYLGWIRDTSGKTQTLKLDFLVPVGIVGDGRRVSLTAPAATTSELRLEVLGKQLVANVSSGATLIGVKPLAADASEIQVAGLSGECQVTWADSGQKVGPVTATLEASSSVVVRVEGPQRVTSEARIKVRSYGTPLEVFRVRLPAGMEWFPLNEPGYRVIPITAGGGDAATGPLVEVVPDAKDVQQLELRLRAVVPAQSRPADEPIETLGFEVIGAVRQFGQVEFVLEGDWAVDWPDRQHVQQLEVTDAARAQRVAARFEFYRQPCSLKVLVQPRQTRIVVEPTYVLTMDTRRAHLDAILRYKVRGPAAARVQVELPGWKTERVYPESLVRDEAFQPGKTQPLVIPLANDLANLREFELRIEASRELPDDGESVALPLPRPEANFTLPSHLIVVAADNMALTPRLREMPGLVPHPVPKDVELPVRQQPPLCYEMRGDLGQPQFAANIQRRQRSLAVATQTTLRWESDKTVVEQRLAYRIANEPIRQLPLALPREVIERQAVQVFLERDDRELIPLAVIPPPFDADTPANVVATVECPSELLGAAELLVRYEGTWANPQGTTQPGSWRVPLSGPAADANTRVTGQRLRIVPPPLAAVEVADPQWSPETSSDLRPLGRELMLNASSAVDGVTLRVTESFAREGGSTWVAKSWIQTWMGNAIRQDRVALRLKTNDPQVVIQLPAETRLNDVVAALDGQSAVPVVMKDGRVRIDMFTREPTEERLIELSYVVDLRADYSHPSTCELPQVVGAANVQRLYWQLVVPNDHYLVATPAGLVPDAHWVWTLGLWDRQARWTQRDLERWIGAAPQTDLPSETNEYLFCAFGSLPTVHVWLVPRSWLIFGSSGLVLCCGLLLLYVPALRHPALLWFAAVAVGGLFWWLPAVAVVVGQTGVLGLTLALMARVLRTLTLRRQITRSTARASGLSALESKATEVRLGRSDSGYQATTATVPPPQAMSAAVPKV